MFWVIYILSPSAIPPTLPSMFPHTWVMRLIMEYPRSIRGPGWHYYLFHYRYASVSLWGTTAILLLMLGRAEVWTLRCGCRRQWAARSYIDGQVVIVPVCTVRLSTMLIEIQYVGGALFVPIWAACFVARICIYVLGCSTWIGCFIIIIVMGWDLWLSAYLISHVQLWVIERWAVLAVVWCLQRCTAIIVMVRILSV